EAFPFTTAGFQDWIELFEEALFAAGAIYAVIELVRLARSGKAPQARIYALLLLWLLVPIAVYLRHSEVLSWRHFAVTIPLPAVFTALLLDRLWPWFDAPVLTALSANSLAMAGLYLAVAPTCTTDNVYGLPYQTTFDAAASIERLAVASGTRRVYLDGYPALTPILSSILTREGLDPVWSNPEQGSELAALPAASPPSVYVTLADATPTSQVLRTAFSDSQASAQALPCVGMQLRTYALDPATLSSALEGLPSASLKLAAANGLQLDRALVARRLSPGQPLQAGLVWIWPGGSRPDSSYWAFAHLLDSAGKVVGQTDVPLRPPAGWVAGEQVVSWLPIQVPGDAVPGRYTLEVGIYGEHAVRSELFDASGKPAGDSAVIQPLAVPPPTSASAPVLTPVARGFGDEIELTGYSLSGSQLLLQWQALKAPRLDYTVFIHLLDSSGQLLAQADAQPLEGDFPTTLWQPGETVLDPHQLPALPPGVARIEVGLYYQPALKRLPGDPVLIPSS
ncbi:MAG TPA: hypothetical protein VKU60_16615, partial [Chloroflexota bacterium]|nr:hypothetical protein [Chloroflexota bacterium]